MFPFQVFPISLEQTWMVFRGKRKSESRISSSLSQLLKLYHTHTQLLGIQRRRFSIKFTHLPSTYIDNLVQGTLSDWSSVYFQWNNLFLMKNLSFMFKLIIFVGFLVDSSYCKPESHQNLRAHPFWSEAVQDLN